MSRAHLDLGAAGESAAATWYRNQGFEILAANWRHGRGELDLIAATSPPGPSTVVFVEVKTRRSDRHGGGAAAVDRRKQRRIRTLAGAWLAQSERWFDEIRFDVVDVDGRGHLVVHEAAF